MDAVGVKEGVRACVCVGGGGGEGGGRGGRVGVVIGSGWPVRSGAPS